jgi:hypothetical protein
LDVNRLLGEHGWNVAEHGCVDRRNQNWSCEMTFPPLEPNPMVPPHRPVPDPNTNEPEPDDLPFPDPDTPQEDPDFDPDLDPDQLPYDPDLEPDDLPIPPV